MQQGSALCSLDVWLTFLYRAATYASRLGNSSTVEHRTSDSENLGSNPSSPATVKLTDAAEKSQKVGQNKSGKSNYKSF